MQADEGTATVSSMPSSLREGELVDSVSGVASSGSESLASTESFEALSVRIGELEAAILTDRRILMGGGLQCPCPGCGPGEEEFDPWAPAPSQSAVGAFGVQQPQRSTLVPDHSKALNMEVTERLEFNQLELAELRQKLSASTGGGPVSSRSSAV